MDDLVNREKCSELFFQVIQQNLSNESWNLLCTKVEQIKEQGVEQKLNSVFAQVSRITGKRDLSVDEEDSIRIKALVPGFSWAGWTVDRLTRVWLLLQVPDDNEAVYLQKINALFDAAEMNELIALYSALPFLSYGAAWIGKCEEGIRSNIGTVLEAIMYNNPYPAAALSEAAWNQLVLKAFFTDKDTKQIAGLVARANLPLANTLDDYVAERLAAQRTVHPEIYKLIELGKFKK